MRAPLAGNFYQARDPVAAALLDGILVDCAEVRVVIRVHTVR